MDHFPTEGRQPVLVFAEDGRSAGVAVDEILDVVEERLDLEMGSDRPGVIGSAIIKGKATEVLDIAWHMQRAWNGAPQRKGKSGTGRNAVLLVEADAFSRRMLAPLHEADIADVLEQLSAGQQEVLATITPDIFTGEVLAELEPGSREVVMSYLDASHLAAAIQELDSDDATEVVEELDDEVRAAVLAEISEIDRQAVEQSLAFEDETAGRLMQREFVAAPEFWSVGHALDHMRASDDLPDKFHDLFVIDTGFRPVGEIPVCRLLSARRDVALSDLMEPPRILVDPETDQEEVAYLFQKYHLVSAPVVDTAGRLTGMLTLDDIVHVIQDENKEDMLALAGVNEAGLADTVVRSVRSRAPWLLVNLATAVLASGVIALFDNFTVLQNDDPIGASYRCQPMGDDERSSSMQETGEGVLNLKLRIAVDACRRFVEHEDLCIRDECSGETHELSLSEREVYAALVEHRPVALLEPHDEVVSADCFRSCDHII